jgi:predicted adenylyl cyclase CyaB
MIEVETKASFGNRSIEEVRKMAGEVGKYSGTVTKIDDYYTMEDFSHFPKKSLRVRRSGGFYVVNFKQRLSLKDSVHAKKEVEFEASDIRCFLNLINDFGFKKWLTKEKHCEIYKIKSNFQIELNNIKGLGWFAEVEYLVDDVSEIDAARKEVLTVMEKLGFKKKEFVAPGYTKLLWDRMH